MKSLFLIHLISLMSFQSSAQDSMEKIMEGRAKEMFRVITLNDKDQWRKFLKENFTQAFVDRNMKTKLTTSDGSDETSSTKESTAASNLEAKVAMFARLHEDFGDGKITALKTNGGNVDMRVDTPQLKGTFTFKFENKKPYLIDGIGIEAGN